MSFGLTYLGDDAFVAFDGHALVLTTEDGSGVTNRIVLDPAAWYALVTYAKQLETPVTGEARS